MTDPEEDPRLGSDSDPGDSTVAENDDDDLDFEEDEDRDEDDPEDDSPLESAADDLDDRRAD